MSGEVPEGWKATTLGEQIDDMRGGGTPSRKVPEYWAGDIPWASVKDLKATILDETEESISLAGLSASASHLIPKGTIIIATRMAVGKAVRFSKNVAINQDLRAIFPKSTLNVNFLHQWLNWREAHVASLGSGSTVLGIRQETLKGLALALPPLTEQRRIAEILSSVDEVIAATRAVIAQTRKVKQAALERLLTKGIGHTRFKQTEIGEIPEGWEVKSVDQLCVLSNGNGFRPPDWSDQGLPIIRIQNLNGSKIFNYFNGKPIEKWLINPGDLLFAWAGVRGVSFGPTIWPGPLGVLNQHIFKIRCLENVDKIWLFLTLKLITSKIESKAHGFKDSLVHVHKKEIIGQLVAVPPFAEQVKISTRAAEVQAAEDANQIALERLISFKSALMSDLLTGRKRVTDALPLAAE